MSHELQGLPKKKKVLHIFDRAKLIYFFVNSSWSSCWTNCFNWRKEKKRNVEVVNSKNSKANFSDSWCERFSLFCNCPSYLTYSRDKITIKSEHLVSNQIGCFDWCSIINLIFPLFLFEETTYTQLKEEQFSLQFSLHLPTQKIHYFHIFNSW